MQQAHDRPSARQDVALRILLVEDDPRTAAHLIDALSDAGWRVTHAADGAAGHELALSSGFDVLVVDRMLPRRDGLALVRALRAEGRQTPVLFLTTMSGIDDRVEGLEAGADDYLVKPFALQELIARVRALARRPLLGRGPTHLRVADLDLDVLTRTVRRAGRSIDLQPREFQLLEFLMRHAGHVVTRRQLLEAVWDFHFVPQTNIVETHMSRLRGKIDRDFEGGLIATVRGVGYVLRDPRA